MFRNQVTGFRVLFGDTLSFRALHSTPTRVSRRFGMSSGYEGFLDPKRRSLCFCRGLL